MSFWKVLAVLSVILIGAQLGTDLLADTAVVADGALPNSPDKVQASDGEAFRQVSLLSNREFVLSILILTFGIVIVLVQFFLLRSAVETKTENIANTNLVTLIIIGTLVLISSGFTNEQIAPALGLFGTIAGYILGRSDATKKD